MNLSIRMRADILAGVVMSAMMIGCQTCRDYVDRIPRPELPSLRTITPFRKSVTPTPLYAEPLRQPSRQAAPVQRDLPILPAPATTNTPSRSNSRPASRPPALPPYDPETPVPSAGLFPPGPVRKIQYKTSSVIKDSNILQTGCCYSTGPTSCCPPSCCPTACCVTSCCPTDCCMKNRLLGAVTRPYYSMKYRLQNAKDRLRCKLSSIGSCCCSPCSMCCDPCSSCVSNGCIQSGTVIGPYPVSSSCSPYAGGVVSPFPNHSHAAARNLWRQPVQNFRRPPCACQSQQYSTPYLQQYPHALPQPFQTPQYQGVRQAYPTPQAAVQPGAVSQPLAQSNRPQTALSEPVYTAPQPVQPSQPVAESSQTTDTQVQSKLTPGHSPLPGKQSRTAKIFRATRLQ